jgi:ComF family protein
MAKNTNEFLRYLLELFFPRRCAGCGVFDKDLCASCAAKLKLSPFSCIFCGQENNDGRTCLRCKFQFSLDGLCSAVSYHDSLAQTIIAAFKYRNHRGLVVPIASLMRRSGTPAGDILLALPLARARQRERGYNQAALLARELSVIAAIPFPDQSPLVKIRATPQQAKAKSREERFTLIKDAFVLRKETSALIAGKRIILVDDVATSGATLNEAARVLKDRGASSVWGWVFAHN